MIISKISGGLGNQMFQYAAGKTLALRLKKNLKLDLYFYKTNNQRRYALNRFNINEVSANKIELTKFKIGEILSIFFPYTKNRIFLEGKEFTFNKTFLYIKKNVYLNGYWQNQLYFKEFRPVLLKKFTLKKKSKQFNKFFYIINSCNSVSIHIRRGDYVFNSKIALLHGNLDLDYYKQAITEIKNLNKESCFFVFSDDAEWVIRNLTFLPRCKIISGQGLNENEELILMSTCKNNIIANSSFSWWGAWLNRNPDKIVIAPKKWFVTNKFDTRDLIPTNWIKI